MTEGQLFSQYLSDIALNAPKDAVALRSASAQVIAKWIKCGSDYPNDLIDTFVYTESSIENSIVDNSNNAVALQKECSGAYEFHIQNF